MPRLSIRNPSYRLHKPTGQAVVTLNGSDHYLGPHGTKASRTEYDRLIGEWLANGRQRPGGGQGSDLSVLELANRFRVHVRQYYRHPDGRPTKEVACFRYALRLLRQVHGDTPAAAFGPLALQALRQRMIGRNWSRGYINQQTRRIRAVFRWGVAQQLIPPAVYHGLQAVSGLKYGRSDARETPPVRPVPEEIVEQTLRYTTPTLAAMVRLQLRTGMRPGEVCQLRECDLDRTGPVWVYRPVRHKMAYTGRPRWIPIGPQGQHLLKPYLGDDPQAFVFSPRRSESERLAALHAARATPLNEGNRPGTHRTRRPSQPPGECYTTQAYDKAIAYACDACWPLPTALQRKRGEIRPKWKQRLGARWQQVLAWRREHRWSANRLRHTAATRLRQDHGIEMAQTILGHRLGSAVTEVYAEANVVKALELVKRTG